jgi:hypothetical protein
MFMIASQQQKNLCFKILKKSYPDLHSTILLEVEKGFSKEGLARVSEIKQMFDDSYIKDRRLFVEVVIKIFHPSLYENDNKNIPLQRGLNKKISEQLSLQRSNTIILVKQVRTWLKFNVDDLKTKADAFYELNFKQ